MSSFQENSSLSQSDQSLLVDYLYCGLTEAEILNIEERIKSDPIFAQAVTQQKEFDSLIPLGSAPLIDNQRMSGVHWSTQRALRQQKGRRFSITSLMNTVWQSKVSMRFQLASVMTAFVVGFIIAQPELGSDLFDGESDAIRATAQTEPATDQSADLSMLPVSLIQNGDFEITNLSLDSIDSRSGAVKVTYSLVSQTSLNGNIKSQEIQGLLASTIRNDVSDGTRLALVRLLKDQTDTTQVRDALSHSLLNDPNPGVRMAAAESLVKISHKTEVRDILRQVLKNDTNPGIRIKAFQALTKYSAESETQKTLKESSLHDNNQYIREQAKNLLNMQTKTTQSNSI